MKHGWPAAVFSALTLAAGAIRAAAVAGFGPANCVSLSRSNAGTCVLRTKCAGQDLSSFDVSFDCLAQSGSRQTHSMGIGSFDQEEEYDTDLTCQECLPPATAVASSAVAGATAGVSLASVSVSREVAKLQGARLVDEPAPKAEWYGPEECVGIWRDDKSGSCVMQTDCDKDTQLDVYEFGLVCVDEDNEMTRHLFGMGSFGHKETFNTLIKCSKCQALDEYMNGNKAVNALGKMVGGMKDDLTEVSGAVSKLNAEVFPQKAAAPASAPAAASPAPAMAPAKPVKAAAPPAKFLLAAAKEASPPQPQEPQPQTRPSPKQDVTVAEESGDVVQHVKVKKSQVQEASMQDILAAAVKGAEDRGAVFSTAKKQELANKEDRAAKVAPVTLHQADQEVVAQKHPVAQHEYITNEDDDDEDAEEDHSKDAEEDED